jgi:high-affinity nickel-transport protein
MIGLLSIMALGLVLGMRHATDPDHVIAVTTIVSRHRNLKDAALIGTLWGVGHTITMLCVGGAIVLLGWAVPARLGLWMEFAVALMLVLLGALNLTGILQWFTGKMSGLEDTKIAVGADHGHTHCAATDRLFGKMGAYQTIRPFVVGVVHGLAGSAAIALLVLATIRNPKWAVAYLLVFGGGTVLGMILITAAIAVPFTFADKLSRKTNSGFQFASGVISLGFGLFLTYQTVFVSGLFSGHPQWTPH